MDFTESNATIGIAFSSKATVTTQEIDDGTYTYSWRFPDGSDTYFGLTIDDTTSSTPTISGVVTPDATAIIWVYCDVTDSFGNAPYGEKKITVNAAYAE